MSKFLKFFCLCSALIAASLVGPAEAADHKKHKHKAKTKTAATAHDKAPQAFGERAELMRFAAELATEQGWDVVQL
ncbi:hypothetical protein ACVBEH_29320, partial [Roseateles sp. GG27B]